MINDIKKMIKPSVKDELLKKKTTDIAYSLVNELISKYPEIVGIEIGGSIAKGTWIDDADIDIFVKFKETTSSDDIEKIVLEMGFVAFKEYSPNTSYSEHPYVKAKIQDTEINLVPCYDVKIGKWRSSADRSIHHTKFMRESLTPKMRDQVRILKKFLKVNGIYGAEIAKQGLGGYVTEVLIYHYHTFTKVTQIISKINDTLIVGNPGKKFDTPIIIIDPIDENRNLAAAISLENLAKFVLACRAYQTKSAISMFQPKRRIAKRYWKNVLIIKVRYKSRSPDIVWGQTKRLCTTLVGQLEMAGFDVVRSGSFVSPDELFVFFLLGDTEISDIYTKHGPDFFRIENSKTFVEKNLSNEMMWVGEDGNIISLKRRQFTRPDLFMKHFLQNNLKRGIPSGLLGDLKRGFDISMGEPKVDKSIKEAISEIISTNEQIFYSDNRVC